MADAVAVLRGIVVDGEQGKAREQMLCWIMHVRQAGRAGIPMCERESRMDRIPCST